MSSKEATQTTNYSFPYMREVNTKTKFQRFLHAIWDPDEHKLFGRTGKSWAQLLVFYTIFYIVLVGLFAISMKGLLSTIDDDKPKWQLEESLIGVNPGVGFRPISDETDEGSLIWYSPKKEEQIKKWVDLLNKFLEPYNASEGTNRELCSYDKPPSPGKVCDVDIKSWKGCTADDSFSYPNSSPCIFIKLNRIFGWVPKVYDDPKDLPEDMPKDLKDHINSLPEAQRKQVWVSCEGEDPADKEIMRDTTIEYTSGRGLPLYYYPFTNKPGYLSPLIAIRLVHPPMNRIVNIECRAWAKNIKYIGGSRDREGSVHFEVMID